MQRRLVTITGFAVATALCCAVARAGGPCQPAWLPTFGGSPGTSGPVLALAAYDDGLASSLFVGGSFDRAGGLWDADNVASWDGRLWATPGFDFGGGLNGAVHALFVHDGPSGPTLYAAGAFTSPSRVARWDGPGWSALGSGTNGVVNALAAYNEGGGEVLFAGGVFSTAGGAPAINLARWDGTSWSSVDGGANQAVYALTVYDDGTGDALYVGGSFMGVGSVPASRIARWDGTAFTPLGTGLNGPVFALAVFDDGGGPALYAGGSFTASGTLSTSRIARWNGINWASVGGGTSSTVRCLTPYDDGGGEVLVAGGAFGSAGGTTAGGVARWNGASWSPFGSSTSADVTALAAVDGPGGATLFAGGTFEAFGGLVPDHIAAWDGSSWSALGGAPSHPVHELEVHDDGAGLSLFVGGELDSVGGLPARYAARWDGSGWTALPGLTRRVYALESHDDGTGSALYAGLQSTVTRWDGTAWSPLVGDQAMGPMAWVYALRSWDDGGGPALYAGGTFLMAGGVPANHVARWDGNAWSALGSGMQPNLARVKALEVWDDGSGPALYAAGNFTAAGGSPAGSVARWDGSAWTGVPGLGGTVEALAVFDGGNGPELIAAGYFDPHYSIARWDGTAWRSLGIGLIHITHQGYANALVVFDDGGGPDLYVAGLFSRGSWDIARWDGASWSGLGWGVETTGNALAVYDDGSGGGEALFLGSSGVNYNVFDAHLGKWGCPATAETTFCVGSPVACPCGNGGLAGRGCDVAQATGGVELALLSQATAPNGATLRGVGFPLGERPAVVVLRSSALVSGPVALGDGLSCLATSSLVRLAAEQAAGGVSTHALGHGLYDGPGLFYYQLAFRNTPATYCTPAAFNLSSGVRLTW